MYFFLRFLGQTVSFAFVILFAIFKKEPYRASLGQYFNLIWLICHLCDPVVKDQDTSSQYLKTFVEEYLPLLQAEILCQVPLV